MSNRRAPGQKLINFPAKENFVKFVDGKLSELNYTERAQFIRDAMREKIERELKIKVEPDLALPPGRVGKGGAKYLARPTNPLALNDKPSSMPPSVPARVLKQALASGDCSTTKRRRSRAVDAPSGSASAPDRGVDKG